MGRGTFRRDKLDTLIKLIQNLVKKQPDQELFVFYKGEVRTAYTSRQLFELAGKFAHRLRHQYGLSQGDVVANTLPNSPERLITDLGINLAGCITLNGQILLLDGEDFFLNARRSRAQAVVVNPKETSPAWRLIKPYVVDINSPHTAHLSCDRAPDLTTAIFVSRETMNHSERNAQPFIEELDKSTEEIFVESSVKSEDIAAVMLTSGSTGYSKLIPWSHNVCMTFWDDILTNGSEPSSSRHEEVFYNDRPFGWGGGHPVSAYLTGFKRVMLDAFDATGLRPGEDIWRSITQERCTMAVIFPLDFEQVLAYIKHLGDCSYKLRTLFTGAQPLRQSQIKDMQTIAEEVSIAYGSTEAGVLSKVLVKAAEFRDFLAGKPQEGEILKIVDENTYQECKPLQVGLILAKGQTILKGYFNRLEDPDPNNARLFTKDGWFITEDMGYFDEEGRLYVVGRNKDIIMYGAVVVYPGWLEARIVKHPDIMDACVVPVSDPVLFHNICACIKPQPGSDLTEEKLKKICEQMFIVESEAEGVPMPEFFLILDKFPETTTGKPDKKKMTAMAEERFGHKEKVQP